MIALKDMKAARSNVHLALIPIIYGGSGLQFGVVQNEEAGMASFSIGKTIRDEIRHDTLLHPHMRAAHQQPDYTFFLCNCLNNISSP